ncbi:MAG: ToxA protein (SAM-dependent methyltransferases) [Candidatus Berkelbacteria bacterium Gr01-1014_85]|uniref:ToxA protein (SAM-dependent methyltransferases) n=1 Tax=Candidatus Berkelbacteria bacterium Gr01-1014_85 TaxID=2017150 RepID=A0A554JBI5_9BACT|nr:MAG: ToxA protein (SAM-dependent methyltransferases) [Candidatus Berkelbacteria bacterium Gr01-1014_85]
MENKYGSFVSGDPMRNFLHYPSVMAELGDLRGKHILDVGCGSGLFDRILAQQGASVLAYDGSAKFIAEAKHVELNHPQGIQFIQAEASQFRTAELCDDAVSVLVLPYIDNEAKLGQTFATTARALKERGRFVSAVINPDFKAFGEVIANRRFTLVGEGRVQVEFLDPKTLERSLDVVELSQFSREAYEDAALGNGFGTADWKALHPTEAGIEQLGFDFWEQIRAEQPYAILVVAK